MNLKFTHPFALLALLGGMALATASCADDTLVSTDGGNPTTPDATPVGKSITLRATLPAAVGTPASADATAAPRRHAHRPHRAYQPRRQRYRPRRPARQLPEEHLGAARHHSHPGQGSLHLRHPPFDATRTAVFTTTDGSTGSGSTKAVFTGADITYGADAPYYFAAYYPAKVAGTDPATLNDGFSYAGQVQRGNGDMRHLGDFDYMQATSSSSSGITSLADADLQFNRASTFFRFVITMPAAGTPVSLNLTAVPPRELPGTAGILRERLRLQGDQ